MDTTKKFPNLEDIFNELWMYSDQKDFKEAYKDIYPASNLCKIGNTKLTKFLISLGDRLQKQKNSSIESDEIRESKERKESLTTSERSSRDEREGHERKPDSSCSPRISKEEATRGQSNLITHRKFSDQRPSPLQGNIVISIDKDKDSDPYAKKGGSVERTLHATPKSKVGSASKKLNSFTKAKILKYNKRKSFLQSLLAEMARLDDFKPVESVDFPVNTLRFGDESIHTIYEWIAEPVKEGKIQDVSISKTHNFKTSFAKIKHDKFNKMYYGVDESDFEDDLSEGDLSLAKSDKSLSDTSDEDEPGPKRYHYQRFKIPSFGEELYKFEKKFNRYLEIKLKKTYQDLFGFKERIYCEFSNPAIIHEAKRRYIKKIFDEPRNQMFRKIRKQHDKFYKYDEDKSGCKKVQAMDDIRRAEYLLEKFLNAEKDYKPLSETFEDTGLSKKKLERLEKLFKFETDTPIDVMKGTSISSLTFKLEESAVLARTLLRETIYDVLAESIFDYNFDRLFEIESEKHDPAMRLNPKEVFSMSSLISESEDDTEEEKVKHILTNKKMIVGRDFSKVPLKVIKGLEKMGFLYEGELYEKPDHPLYKININEERKSNLIALEKDPSFQVRRSSSNPLSPLVTKKLLTTIQKPKRPTGGLDQHKDSLGKEYRSKHKTSAGGSKESLIGAEEIQDEEENEAQSPTPRSDIKKGISTTPNSPKASPQLLPMTVLTSEIHLTSPVENKVRQNSIRTSISKQESAMIRKNKGKQPQKGNSRYALTKTASETKKKNFKENDIDGSNQIKLSESPVEDSNALKGKRDISPVKSREERGRSTLNPSDSPRPSQGGKGKSPNIERLKSIYDRKKSLSPGFRIEFDPISSGTITEAMQEFASIYHVPINQLSKLTDGILNIEPEERKDSNRKKIGGRRRTDEGLSKVKALRIKSEEKEVNSRKSIINKSA